VRLGRHILRLPWDDTLRGLERSLAAGWPGLARIFVGLVLGWWIYVPIHELLHAAACAVTGGEVSELQISPLYGGALLARLFPFVTSGGDYAGRLAGFDTGGSDFVYLATVLGPYLLTVFPGVWWLRRAGARGPGAGQGLLYGAALPVALAPFVSLPGDSYEIGSIVTTWVPPWAARAELLRGDDVGLLAGRLAEAGAGPVLWSGLALGLVVGLAWAFLTYGLGAGLAAALTRSTATSKARSS